LTNPIDGRGFALARAAYPAAGKAAFRFWRKRRIDGSISSPTARS
jgi:hypothetical protein